MLLQLLLLLLLMALLLENFGLCPPPLRKHLLQGAIAGIDLLAILQKEPGSSDIPIHFDAQGSIEWHWSFDHHCAYSKI